MALIIHSNSRIFLSFPVFLLLDGSMNLIFWQQSCLKYIRGNNCEENPKKKTRQREHKCFLLAREKQWQVWEKSQCGNLRSLWWLPSSPLEGTWLDHLKGKTNTPLSGREFGQMAYFRVNSYMCLLKAQRKKK